MIDLIEQVESCQFECEAGPLTMSLDWIAVKDEIERLTAELIYRNEVIDQRNVMLTHHQSEATCNYCNEYHGREVCAALQADNERLRAVLKPFAGAHYAMAEPNIIIDPYDHITLYDIRQAAEALAAVEDKT